MVTLSIRVLALLAMVKIAMCVDSLNLKYNQYIEIHMPQDIVADEYAAVDFWANYNYQRGGWQYAAQFEYFSTSNTFKDCRLIMKKDTNGEVYQQVIGSDGSWRYSNPATTPFAVNSWIHNFLACKIRSDTKLETIGVMSQGTQSLESGIPSPYVPSQYYNSVGPRLCIIGKKQSSASHHVFYDGTYQDIYLWRFTTYSSSFYTQLASISSPYANHPVLTTTSLVAYGGNHEFISQFKMGDQHVVIQGQDAVAAYSRDGVTYKACYPQYGFRAVVGSNTCTCSGAQQKVLGTQFCVSTTSCSSSCNTGRCVDTTISTRFCENWCDRGDYFSAGNCTSCPVGCYMCNTDGSCRTCAAGMYMDSQAGTCGSSCPNNTVTNSSRRSCDAVDTNCMTLNTTYQCTSGSGCREGYRLHNGVCVSTCPVTTYFDQVDIECKACVGNCDECNDGTACLVCSSGYKMVGGACVTTACADGTYLHTADRVCRDCHPHCAKCSTDTGLCTECKPTPRPYLLNGECLAVCPQYQYFQNTSSKICERCTQPNCQQCNTAADVCELSVETCFDGHFRIRNGFCINCHSECLTCSDNGSQFCLSCDATDGSAETPPRSPRYLHGTECLLNCPDGFYKDAATATCIACPHPSKNCTSPTVFQSCLDGYYHLGTDCLKGYYLKTETDKTPLLPLNPATMAATILQEFTVEVWFRKDPASTQPDDQVVLGAYPWKFKLASVLNSTYLMTYKNSFTFCNMQNLDPTKWYFFTWTLSQENALECYLNSDVKSIGSQNPAGPAGEMLQLSELTLGSSSNSFGTEQVFQGFFLELRYWKVRRTPQQVKDYMDRTWLAGTVPTSLLSYWRINQEFHTTNITDSAASGLMYDSSTAPVPFNIDAQYLPYQPRDLVLCENNKYLSNFQCLSCHSDCLACSGSLSSNCISCSSPNFFDSALNLCTPTCPQGTYGDPVERVCTPCHSNCVTCSGSKTNCPICKPGKFLLGTQCMDICLPGYYGDTSTAICYTNPTAVISSPSNMDRFPIQDIITLEGSVTPLNGENSSVVIPKWTVKRVVDGMEIGGDALKTFYDHQVDLKKMHLDRNIISVNQFYDVTLHATTPDPVRYTNMLSNSTIRIFVGAAPENGTCTIDKAEGKPEQTVFNISAPDWKDSDGVAEYLFSFSYDSGNNFFPIQNQQPWIKTLNFTFPLTLENKTVILKCEAVDTIGLKAEATTQFKLYLDQITVVNLPITAPANLATLDLNTLLGTNTYLIMAHYLQQYSIYFGKESLPDQSTYDSSQSNCRQNGTAFCGETPCLESAHTQGFFCNCSSGVFGKRCKYTNQAEYLKIQSLTEGVVTQYDSNFTFDANPTQAAFFLSLSLSFPDYVTLPTLNSAASIFKKHVDNWVQEGDQEIKLSLDVASLILEGYQIQTTRHFAQNQSNPDAATMETHLKMVRDAMEKVEKQAVKSITGKDPFKQYTSSGVSLRVQRATNSTNLQVDPASAALKAQRTLIKVSPTFLRSFALPLTAALVVKQFKANPYQGLANSSLSVISASVYDVSANSKVSVNGSEPFQIEMALHKNERFVDLALKMNKYTPLKESHRKIRAELLIKWQHQCVYWSGSSWSSQGCQLQSMTKTHVTCSCTHMSDFTANMEPVEDVLPSSNSTGAGIANDAVNRWGDMWKKPGPYLLVIYFFLLATSLSTHIYKDKKSRFNLSFKYIRDDLHYYIQPVEITMDQIGEEDDGLDDSILVSTPMRQISMKQQVGYTFENYVEKFSAQSVGTLKTKADYIFDKAEVLPTLKQEAVAMMKQLFSNTLPLNYMLRTSNLTPRWVKVMAYFSGVAFRMTVLWLHADQWRSMEMFSSATTFFIMASLNANLLNLPLRILLIHCMRVSWSDLKKFKYLMAEEVNVLSKKLHSKMRFWYIATTVVSLVPILVMVIVSMTCSYWWSVSEGFKFITNFLIFVIMDLIVVPLSVNLLHLFMAVVAMRIPVIRCCFVQCERCRLYRNMEGNMHLW